MYNRSRGGKGDGKEREREKDLGKREGLDVREREKSWRQCWPLPFNLSFSSLLFDDFFSVSFFFIRVSFSALFLSFCVGLDREERFEWRGEVRARNYRGSSKSLWKNWRRFSCVSRVYYRFLFFWILSDRGECCISFFCFKMQLLVGYFNYHRWPTYLLQRVLRHLEGGEENGKRGREKEADNAWKFLKLSQERNEALVGIALFQLLDSRVRVAGRGIGLELSPAKHRKSRQPECRALNPAKFPQKERADGPNDCLLESNQRRG